MEEPTVPEAEERKLPEPNPVTAAAHKQDYRRRVLLPFLLIVFLLIAVVVLLVLFPLGEADAGTWAQISSIFLMGLWLVLGLIGLVIVVGLVYLVTSLLKLLPPYTRLAQDGIEKIKDASARGADIPAKSVIQVQGYIAAIRALFKRK